MTKPTEEILRACANLENNISWQTIIDWFEKSLIAQSIMNNHKAGEDTIKGQGKALNMEEFLKYAKKPQEFMVKK